ncbi:hypothetical protein ACHQM5_027736 [Ranunculus cassubicifolius]
MSSSEKEANVEVPKKRSVRTTPPVYAPSYVIMHGKKYRDQTFCIPSDRSYHVRSIPEMRGMVCLASSYGWLILRSFYSGDCHLFNPTTLAKIQLPTLVDANFNIGVLTSPPSDPSCVIMFFSKKKNLCVFCRLGNTIWTKLQLEQKKKTDLVIDGIRKQAVSCNGKIYLPFHRGMAIIDIQDPFACIETYERKPPKHLMPPNTASHFYFLESLGEIFQVVMVFLGMTEIVQSFIVLKLELSTMAWEKVESLGDRIFLLATGSSSVSVAAAEFGAKGNCIYFIPWERTNLCCFDMDDGTITITQPCPSKFPDWDGLFWVVPNCKVQLKKEVAEITEENQVNNCTLPTEILGMVFQSLFLDDSMRFRLACKAFMSMIPPLRSFLQPQTLPDSQHLPWLISLPRNKEEICHFYHPIYTDAYNMNFPQLAGAVVRDAKSGWLLMSVGKDSYFFFNPFTEETIKLPDYKFCHFTNVSFSSPPTSADCVVFGHLFCWQGFVLMSFYRKSNNRWSSCFLTKLPYTFLPSHCNPVFHGGLIYSLSKDAKLGVFNPNGSNEEEMWRVYTNLSVPDVTVTETSLISQVPVRSFIMECNGEIFSVFVGYIIGSPVSVYKLDQSKKTIKWIKVENLGDKVMFLSHSTSILVPATLKGTENRIYFPRLKNKAAVYYSLTSGKYHSFGDQNSQANWIDTSEHWNCAWFQMPSPTHPSSN